MGGRSSCRLKCWIEGMMGCLSNLKKPDMYAGPFVVFTALLKGQVAFLYNL